MTVTEACAELSVWLGAHLPSVVSHLRPPADDVHWEHFCGLIGQPLPEDLRELYAWHDGQRIRCSSGLFYSQHFISLEAAHIEWASWASIISDEAGPDAWRIEGEDTTARRCTSAIPGLVRPAYASRGWIPFTKDWSGRHLAIDLDPGEQGIRGQVINIGRDEESKVVLAPSLASFLEWYSGQLKNGNYLLVDTESGAWLRIKEPDCECFLEAALTLFGPSSTGS